MNQLKTLSGFNKTIKAKRKIIKDKQDSIIKIKHEKKKTEKSVILELFEEFLSDMRQNWDKQNYIQGSYTSEFTRHVSRSGLYISEKHSKMQGKYIDALQDLNESFIKECLDNTENIRMRLQYAGLKNLHKI